MTPQEFKKNRRKLGLSQKQLAKELGFSEKHGRHSISRIEKGIHKPRATVLKCFYYILKEHNKPTNFIFKLFKIFWKKLERK